MNKSCYFILLLIISNFQQGKIINKTSEKVTEEEIYEVINFVLLNICKNDSLENNQYPYIVDELCEPSFIFENPNFKEKLKDYFSDDDIKFINQQVSQEEKFKLSQKLLKQKKLISKSDLDKMIDYNTKQIKNNYFKNYTKKFGNKYYYKLSLPVFSLDKKTVLIDVNSFMGSGYSLLLVKQNNIWHSKKVCIWTN